MTLYEQQELWTIQHPNDDFWSGVVVPEIVNKNDLVDYLLYEYGELDTIDNHAGHFKNHITNFFRIHKWNIDKLAKTLEFEYNPIEDTNWHEWFDLSEDETIDHAEDNNIYVNDDEKTTEEDNWSEDDHIDTVKINYVSAYNLDLSPKGSGNNIRYDDSEHHRDTEHTDIDKDGTDDKTTIRWQGTNTDEDRLSHNILDNDKHKDTYHTGNDRNTFQSLIEEERKQALFNIYKWIGKHFSTELLICVW